MDAVSWILSGLGGVTVMVGVAKVLGKPKKGERLAPAAHREVMLCDVCGAEAEEFDDEMMRWVCLEHVTQRSQPGKRRQREPLPAPSRRQYGAYEIDPHDVETLRESQYMRSLQRSRAPVEAEPYEEEGYAYEEEEEVCPHGFYFDECQRCLAVEQRRRAAASRPSQSQRHRAQRPQRQSVQRSAPQSRSGDGVDRETLRYVVDVVRSEPLITDRELAQVLGMRRSDSARFWRLKAYEVLGWH